MKNPVADSICESIRDGNEYLCYRYVEDGDESNVSYIAGAAMAYANIKYGSYLWLDIDGWKDETRKYMIEFVKYNERNKL